MLAAALLSVSLVTVACVPVGQVPGTVVRGFAPVGRYAGHWGVDVAASAGAVVPSATAGTVTFAGAVAGRLSVTVSFGPSVKVSYSYLGSIRVSMGESVNPGDRIGSVGLHGGIHSYHLSLRVAGVYVDPMILDRCLGPPGPGVRLASTMGPYPAGRVRNPRWNVRPAPHRSPRRSPRGLRADGARSRASPPCPQSLAEA